MERILLFTGMLLMPFVTMAQYTGGIGRGKAMKVFASKYVEGDYRTVASGNWVDLAIWERYDGVQFQPATDLPYSSFVDGVVLVRSPHVVTIEDPVSAYRLQIAAGATLVVQHDFTLGSAGDPSLDVRGTLVLDGGTISGNGSIGILGQFNWQAGSMTSFSMMIEIRPGGAGVFSSIVNETFNGTLENEGSWTQLDGGLTGAGTFINRPDGSITWVGGLDEISTISLLMTNHGTITKSGPEVFTIQSSFTNHPGAQVIVEGGELRSSNFFQNNGTVTCSGDGVLRLVNSSIDNTLTGSMEQASLVLDQSTLNSQIMIEIRDLRMESGANVNMGHPLTVTGNLEWFQGNIFASELHIAAGASVNTSSTGTIFTNANVYNAGTWIHRAQLSVLQNFQNTATGVFQIEDPQSNPMSLSGDFYNEGTVHKYGNYDTHYQYDSQFTNEPGGLVHVYAGTLHCFVNFNNYGTIATSGTGLLRQTQGRHTHFAGGNAANATLALGDQVLGVGELEPYMPMEIDHLILDAGIILTGLPVTVTGSFDWYGGQILVGTELIIPPSAFATMDAGANVTCNGTITNEGTWEHLNGDLHGIGTFNNGPGASLILHNSVSPGDSWHLTLNNEGLIIQEPGVVTISQGQFNHLPGSSLLVSGTLGLTIDVTMPSPAGDIEVLIGGNFNPGIPVDYIGSGILNNGTITCPQFSFSGSEQQWLDGSGSMSSLRMDNADGLLLGGIQTVTDQLTLDAGTVTIGWNELRLTNTGANALVGGHANSYLITDAGGSFVRDIASDVCLFPIGSLDAYLPMALELTSGPPERFRARVQEGVNEEYGFPGTPTGTDVVAHVVGHTWVVQEETPGGNTADITLMWDGSEELPGFNAGSCAVAWYDGLDWTWAPLGSATGTDPYARQVSGINNFREFTVADGDALLNGLPPDCIGVIGGDAFIDNCGDCVGGTTGLFPCAEPYPVEGDYRTIASGQWSTAGIWQVHNGSGFVPAGNAPNSSHGNIFIRNGHDVNATGNETVDQVIVRPGGILRVNGSLTVADGPGTDLEVQGELRLQAGSIGGAGLTSVSGSFTWTGGQISSGATLNTAVTAVANFNPTITLSYQGTINNAGTWNHNSGNLHSGGTFNNLPTGVLNFNGALTPSGTWHATVNNQGTVHKNNAGVFTQNSGTFNNQVGGIVSVNQGELRIGGSGGTNAGSITGVAFLHLIAGTFTNLTGGNASTGRIAVNGAELAASGSFLVQHLSLINGQITAVQPVQVSESFTWTNGSISFTANLHILEGAVANFNPNSTLSHAGTIQNAGTWNHNSGNLHNGSGTFNNLSTGVLNFNGALDPNISWQATVNNAGTVHKNNPGNFTQNSGSFNNQAGGIVSVNEGELRIGGSGGTNAGSITGAAFLHLVAGTFANLVGGNASTGRIAVNGAELAASGSFLVQHLSLINGQITAVQPVQVSESFTWTNGSISFTANLHIVEGAVANFNPNSTLSHAGTIQNAGTWNHNSGNLHNGSGTFNNLPTGVLNFNGALDPNISWQATVNNAGTVHKNNPGNFTQNSGSFNNQAGGTVSVNEGELRIGGSGGTNAGNITGSAFLRLIASTFTNLEGGNASTGRIAVDGAELAANGSFLVQHLSHVNGQITAAQPVEVSESFIWTNGSISSTANLHILEGAVANFNPTGARTHSGIIQNAGTWNHNSGDLHGSGTFNNLPTGVLNFNGNSQPNFSWQATVNNQGTVHKNNAGVFTQNSGSFNNLAGGTVSLNEGELRIGGSGGTNAGNITGAAFLYLVTGTFTNLTGGNASTGRIAVNGAELAASGSFLVQHLSLINGQITAVQPVEVSESFTWINGSISSTANLHILEGAVANFNSTGARTHSGIIQNAGTWNHNSGDLHGSGTFNNLPTGVLNFNGTNQPGFSWQATVNNQGTAHKNNAGLFTQNAGGFVQQVNGVLQVNGGTLSLIAAFATPNGTIEVATGATLNTNQSPNFIGTAVENNGTITATQFSFGGSATQTLSGTGSFNNLRFNNASGVLLEGDQTVSNTLTLANGTVTLGDHDLTLSNSTLASLVGGTAANHFITNGTGRFRRAVNGVNYLFPLGTAGSYNPVTLSLTGGPQETFGARVQPGVSTDYDAPGEATGTALTSDVVDRTWVLDEATHGGNTCTVTLHWSAADELSGFDRNNSAMALYDGSDWTSGPLGAASGSNPYSRGLAGVSSFREFSVVDEDAEMNTVPVIGLALRVALEGPYDPFTGLMEDALRSLPDFPLGHPYANAPFAHPGAETIDPALLYHLGPDAVVDWVLVELRSDMDNTLVVESRAGLLLRNGDVVEPTGIGPLAFGDAVAGDFYVAIRHRNHLAAMTRDPITLGNMVTQLDFSQGSLITFGAAARKSITGTYPAEALWAGNVVQDGYLQYTGFGNDRDPILLLIGGLVPTATETGYHPEDVNLDGVVRYTGFGNDRDPILSNIGGTVPTATRVEQLP